jgi:hypothetical protein
MASVGSGDGSPIRDFLDSIDKLDIDGAVRLLAEECRILLVDGQRGEGRASIHKLLQTFLGGLRATRHRITSEWHVDGVWIAEVDASYELQDWLCLDALPRAFFAVVGEDGITDIRVYGAHERSLTAHRRDDESMRVGGRWLLPL